MLETLVILLSRFAALNEAFLNDVCRRHRTIPAELRTLGALRRQQSIGPVSPTTLARWIVQTSGGLTATLRRLEANGYIERQADPNDARGRLVAITEAGAEFCDRVFEDLVARYEHALRDVDTAAALDAVRSLIGPLEDTVQVGSSAGWTADMLMERA
jgi:DNA-binding MarR family transcriptional regulator